MAYVLEAVCGSTVQPNLANIVSLAAPNSQVCTLQNTMQKPLRTANRNFCLHTKPQGVRIPRKSANRLQAVHEDRPPEDKYTQLLQVRLACHCWLKMYAEANIVRGFLQKGKHWTLHPPDGQVNTTQHGQTTACTWLCCSTARTPTLPARQLDHMHPWQSEAAIVAR